MFTFDSRVRYSEIDENGTLALGSVINYMQDCSTFQSEELGLGVAYLREHGQMWLLNSWQIEIERLPVLAEQITIGTWAHGFKGIYGYRNFAIFDREENYLVKANSIWVFYDWNKKRPIKITEEMEHSYGREPKLEMGYAERKIIMPEGGTSGEPFPVRSYQIDTNGHVNNAQYIQMAQECMPQIDPIRTLRAEYRKSAVYGDSIYPVVVSMEGSAVVSLNDKEGKPYAIVAMAR